jgi:electron transfer flavoprotein alpha subunit
VRALLICECRDGVLQDTWRELVTFAGLLNVDTALFLVGTRERVPCVDGRVYLSDSAKYGEYDPEVHTHLVRAALAAERADYIIFLHSSYGWDLAPRVAAALGIAQISAVLAVTDHGFEVGCCGGKMRRCVRPLGYPAVVTIEPGTFAPVDAPEGSPQITEIGVEAARAIDFLGYEAATARDVDLAAADVIVSAGRGIGKEENVALIRSLAEALDGELGASRPVVDAGWIDSGRQVGNTGQNVSPKVYVACGISGAIQHLSGMRRSEFVVAVNTDRNAPISEVADVMAITDVIELVPALIERL